MIKFALLYSLINNLSKTHVILSIPFAAVPGSFQCDFDTNICGWIQDRSDDFDWKRQSGQTGSSNTGPNTDHTTGSGLHEYTPPSTWLSRARLLGSSTFPQICSSIHPLS